MKIGNYNKINRESVPDLPEPLFDVLMPQSKQIEKLSIALQRRLNFHDNMDAEIRELYFLNNSEELIRLQRLNGFPMGVLLLWEELSDYTRLAWRVVDKSSIAVKIVWESSPATATQARIMILGA